MVIKKGERTPKSGTLRHTKKFAYKPRYELRPGYGKKKHRNGDFFWMEDFIITEEFYNDSGWTVQAALRTANHDFWQKQIMYEQLRNTDNKDCDNVVYESNPESKFKPIYAKDI